MYDQSRSQRLWRYRNVSKPVSHEQSVIVHSSRQVVNAMIADMHDQRVTTMPRLTQKDDDQNVFPVKCLRVHLHGSRKAFRDQSATIPNRQVVVEEMPTDSLALEELREGVTLLHHQQLSHNVRHSGASLEVLHQHQGHAERPVQNVSRVANIEFSERG